MSGPMARLGLARDTDGTTTIKKTNKQGRCTVVCVADTISLFEKYPFFCALLISILMSGKLVDSLKANETISTLLCHVCCHRLYAPTIFCVELSFDPSLSLELCSIIFVIKVFFRFFFPYRLKSMAFSYVAFFIKRCQIFIDSWY